LSTALWLFGTGAFVTVGWTCLGVAVGSRLNSYSQRDFLVTVTMLPVVLSAPLFYPLQSAPAYLQVIAAANPLSHQVGWLRLEGTVPAFALLACLTWVLVCAAVAVTSVHTAERITREP